MKTYSATGRPSFWPLTCKVRLWRLGVVAALYTLSACVALPTRAPAERRTPSQEMEVAGAAAYMSLAFSPDGKLLAAYEAFADTVQVLRVSDFSEVSRHKAQARPRRMMFSKDSKYLAIETDVSALARLATMPEKAAREISGKPQTAVPPEVVDVVDVRSGAQRTALKCSDDRILASGFSDDGRWFDLICRDGTDLQWDATTWEHVRDASAPEFWIQSNGMSQARLATMSSGSRWLLVEGQTGPWLWDRAGQQARPLHLSCLSEQGSHAISRDGRQIASICSEPGPPLPGTHIPGGAVAVQLWKVGTEQALPLEDPLFQDRNGLFLLFGIPEFIRYWAGAGYPGSFAISDDGRYLAANVAYVVSDSIFSFAYRIDQIVLRVWRTDNGAKVLSTELGSVARKYVQGALIPGLAFSADGSLLATGGATIRIFRESQLAESPAK